MQYCLADVGILRRDVCDKASRTGENLFRHERQNYFQLNEFLNVKTLLKDVKLLPEYDLQQRTNASDSKTIYLSLFLRRLRPEEWGGFGKITQRRRMVETFFEEVERHDFVRSDVLELQADGGTGHALSVGQFYERLREMHLGDVLDQSIPEDVSHDHLRPSLRPYQIQAIRWMLDRETARKALPAQYVKLRCPNVPEVDFYMYLDSFKVVDELPREIAIPTGGILADEMGLGKTVEILGLLLFNRKKKSKFQEKDDGDDDSGSSVAEEKKEIRCICYDIRPIVRKLITCHKCGLRQHRKCVLKNCVHEPRPYICPECWRSEPLVESGTTIIITPVSIKMQWATEITKHIDDGSFKIFIYEGVSVSGWIDPVELAQYDVVLMDYNVLKTEIYFAADNQRTNRCKNRIMLSSPLLMVRWWRVCLDEAQMVEGIHNQTTKMAKILPAEHRWTVTGTPIEKSMDNLYGLVHFLDYAPYNDSEVWSKLTRLFQQGNPQPLLHVMSQIMWRTCKAAVLDQLGVPPQTEVIHYITMSDLEYFFYRKEHTKCAVAFRKKVAKLTDQHTSMARMNIHTLNKLMEPMRKLRQDCTVPSVLHHSNQLTTKKMLTPTELHEHLVSRNEVDCKSHLRSVVSSINGMASIHVIRNEYDKAIMMYKSALRWVEEYQGSISVDSLLQIHALHNIFEVLRMREQEADVISPEEVAGFEERCAQLEWKYMETYLNAVKSVEQELNPTTEKIEGILAKLNPKVEGQWCRSIIYQMQKDRTKTINFLLKLNGEIRNCNRTAQPIESVPGLDCTLIAWFDKIKQYREKLQKAFQSIDYFVMNLKPKNLWPANAKDRIEKLVRTAFLCHLDSKSKQNLPGKKPMKRTTCILCSVRSVLTQYERVIFQAGVVKSGPSSTMNTTSSWQVTPNELILRQFHAFSKRENLDPAILEEGELYVSYLESIKAEFKQYSKYWVEINASIAAYDELDMCHSRLQVVTLNELDQSNTVRTNQQILDIEVDDTLLELQTQKTESERDFERVKGTLKYLHHLGSTKEIDVCPICQCPPKDKYVVLQCGHHFCIACALKILRFAKIHGNKIDCVVCRHRQWVADIYYVSCFPLGLPDRNTTVRGNYSSKIIDIVETILQLKQKDPQVKIIIFSHWDPILAMLFRALDENSITYRKKTRNFYKAIKEFKETQGRKEFTCMLLPLKYGSKGLNLTEATHVFLVEPILNPGEELQAIGRVHRIGQTKSTFVHRFIVQNTIEETIHQTIQNDQSGLWSSKQVTVGQLQQLFHLT